jgi:hypothetical protein
METDHPSHDKQVHLAKPSLWIAEPLSPLEDALREDDASLRDDEHTDDVRSLLEENTRLRELVVRLSDLIGKNVTHAR